VRGTRKNSCRQPNPLSKTPRTPRQSLRNLGFGIAGTTLTEP
jgi:hypothetical protein